MRVLIFQLVILIKEISLLGGALMNFDDFDDGYEGDVLGTFSENQSESESNLDLFNLRDPEIAYLFLSDDAQKEI
jgi:hypothetical protein